MSFSNEFVWGAAAASYQIEGAAYEDAMEWEVTPEALYWGPRFLYERYNLPVVITDLILKSPSPRHCVQRLVR